MGENEGCDGIRLKINTFYLSQLSLHVPTVLGPSISLNPSVKSKCKDKDVRVTNEDKIS